MQQLDVVCRTQDPEPRIQTREWCYVIYTQTSLPCSIILSDLHRSPVPRLTPARTAEWGMVARLSGFADMVFE